MAYFFVCQPYFGVILFWCDFCVNWVFTGCLSMYVYKLLPGGLKEWNPGEINFRCLTLCLNRQDYIFSKTVNVLSAIDSIVGNSERVVPAFLNAFTNSLTKVKCREGTDRH